MRLWGVYLSGTYGIISPSNSATYIRHHMTCRLHACVPTVLSGPFQSIGNNIRDFISPQSILDHAVRMR